MKRFYQFWNQGVVALGKPTLYILTSLILLRIVSLGLYPLMDSTEGRYGEIARKMAEMNDWITPWFDVGVPFWGKPPLAFWMSAMGIKLFGVNEFAVRVPQFFAAFLVVIICYDWAKRCLINPFYVLAILSSAFLFVALSGAVTTDMALCVGTTLSIRSFWFALRGEESRRQFEQSLFFLGLSIMLLAKGPVGWVLVLMPIALWAIFSNAINETWRGLAWFRGAMLAILIVLPWYLLAEQHAPGFLNYFFVGEHWQRFTVSGWSGDLYGTAHATPRGTIWLYLVSSSLPWSFVFPVALWVAKRKKGELADSNQQQLKLYLLLTGLAPCLFFTMSGNVIWTYILPGLPSLALWLALVLGKTQSAVAKKILLVGTFLSAATIAGLFVALTFGQKADARSAKSIVQLYQKQQSANPLVFLDDRQFSSMFYSKGRALNVRSLADVRQLPNSGPLYVAIRKSQLELLNHQLDGLKLVGETSNYRLYLR